MRLIDADALLANFKRLFLENNGDIKHVELSDILFLITNAPTESLALVAWDYREDEVAEAIRALKGK